MVGYDGSIVGQITGSWFLLLYWVGSDTCWLSFSTTIMFLSRNPAWSIVVCQPLWVWSSPAAGPGCCRACLQAAEKKKAEEEARVLKLKLEAERRTVEEAQKIRQEELRVEALDSARRRAEELEQPAGSGHGEPAQGRGCGPHPAPGVAGGA
ncbi:hypothetical protein HaLaN_19074 [Haematococcus lacustris]|uniref:Uncharacterized protein n=1 Tax=Haematococcus lacustris TaxID=44745 RepID=A0A699ZSJ0_HAELA|nr:hypothetical protein HaLaN_19074 [Haematococcus lacustris]